VPTSTPEQLGDFQMTVTAFGMQLPIQAQSTMMLQPWEPDCGPKELGEIAQAADRAGWNFVSVCDHVAIPTERAAAMSTTWYDTIATLGWLAGITTRIDLAATVMVIPYRHPMVTAKAFTTLDAISGGRIILGVGAGHLEREFGLLGVPFKDRGRLTNEALPIIKAAFADEWGAGDFGIRPRPARAGGPPIWVGGSTMPALRRAAQFGDGWLPQGPPPQGMDQAIADVQRLRQEAGRGDLPFAVLGGLGGAYVGKPSWDLPAHVATGSAEQIAERVRAVVASGVTHVQPRLMARSASEFIDQIEAFGRDVIPLINK
jgi:probable F420-dependent oxidoreductase